MDYDYLDVHKPKSNPDASFQVPIGKTLTAQQLSDFLNLIKATHPEVLEKPLHYTYDGEFWSFSGITFEGGELYLNGDET